MTEGQALGTLNLTPSGFYLVGEQIHSRDCFQLTQRTFGMTDISYCKVAITRCQACRISAIFHPVRGA